MKRIKALTSFALIFVLVMQLFGCTVYIPKQGVMSSADEAEAIGLVTDNDQLTLAVGEFEWLESEIKTDYNYAVKWSTNNPDVATVDSNGRVDGIAPGIAIITAKAEKAVLQYEVTVKEAKAAPAVSTTNALLATENRATIDLNETTNAGSGLYKLAVNMETGCITVYTFNEENRYTIPVRAMICSMAEDTTIYEDDVFYLMDESLEDKAKQTDPWTEKVDGKYYRYSSSFSYGGETYRFTSCAYDKKAPSALNTADYNKLGTNFTKGDIRLSVDDAKWIYNNCTKDTQIKFVTGTSNQDRLGIPKPMRIAADCEIQTWDPTDNNKDNPFLKKGPVFKGMEDMEVKLDEVCDLKGDVEIYDTGNNLCDSNYQIHSKVSRDKLGEYKVTYTYTDSLGRTGRADRIVRVVK